MKIDDDNLDGLDRWDVMLGISPVSLCLGDPDFDMKAYIDQQLTKMMIEAVLKAELIDRCSDGTVLPEQCSDRKAETHQR